MNRLELNNTRPNDDQKQIRRAYIERAIRSIADGRGLLRFAMVESTSADVAKQLQAVISRTDGIVAELARLLDRQSFDNPSAGKAPDATRTQSRDG